MLAVLECGAKIHERRLMSKKEIINIAVIAHVDAGKSTLIDALLDEAGIFSERDDKIDCVMDSDDIERERGITIYAKNCAIEYKGVKINIVDTPGHADFSSEVERIIKTVDTTILLVDSSEGPMPQTRFVLQKSLEIGLKPILLINKIDKKDERADEVIGMTFDLFDELGASEEQLDFPVLYGIAKQGIVRYKKEDSNEDLRPLLDTILERVSPYPDYDDLPLQLQISALDYDEYIGRLGIGRVNRGVVKKSQITVSKRDGSAKQAKISKLFVNQGIKRVEVDEAKSGDIVVIAGIPDISIGETVCLNDNVEPLPMIEIEEPTMSMTFYVNNSPFAGRSGKFLTTRHIEARLNKELETNVGLRVEAIDGSDAYKVSGRGELHLSILIENMRREGYELSVSKPEVLFRNIDGKKCEPFERVLISVPEQYVGKVMQKLNERKGVIESMTKEESHTRLEFSAPTRSLLGYRNEFITDTRGEGIMVRSFSDYRPYAGEIQGRQNGVLISQSNGEAMAYSLFNLMSRGELIVEAAQEVYEGMIVGINNRSEDMVVNPCKNKKLTNTRASGSDDAVKLIKPRTFTLEEALDFIEDDEWIEITPDSIRLRKKHLSEHDRKREYRKAH